MKLLSGVNELERGNAVLGTERSLGKHCYHHYSWEDILTKKKKKAMTML